MFNTKSNTLNQTQSLLSNLDDWNIPWIYNYVIFTNQL